MGDVFMIKGTKKNIIHINDIKNPYVSEMYLVVKETAEASYEEDIVKEAERIALKYSVWQNKIKKKNMHLKLKYLFYGAAILSFVFGLLSIVLN